MNLYHLFTYKVASHRGGKEYVFNLLKTTIGIIYMVRKLHHLKLKGRVVAIRDLFDGTGINYRVTDCIKENMEQV